MADIVSPEKRSEMMSGIRSKNTQPELLVRKALHRKGFRFRIHRSDLPGRPDLVFPKLRAVMFTHGCFWHCHDCLLFKWPSSRADFWKTKISRNREKDKEAVKKLLDEDWRVMIIWECSLKGTGRFPFEKVISRAVKFLSGKEKFVEIRGDK